MADDYTPSPEEARAVFIDGAEGEFVGEDFDRMIAQVRADALRDAREALIADQINLYGIVPPDVEDAVDRMDERANRIEREE